MLLQGILVAILWQSVSASSNNCSSSVTISSQSDADYLSDCDNFDGSITISSTVTGAITLSNVEKVNGAFTAEGASALTRLIAPDLDTVKGALTLHGLDSLTTLTMNALSQVSSGFIITNNSHLKIIDFEDLEEVDGQLLLAGSFERFVANGKTWAQLTDDSVSLPSLDKVKGQAIIRGGSSMSCSTLNSLKSDGVFKGGYSCSTESSGNTLNAGAKGGIAVGVIVAVLFILLLLWYTIRQRRQRKSRHRGAGSPLSPAVLLEKPPGSHYHSVSSDGSQPASQTPPPSSLSSPPLASAPVNRKPIGPSPVFLDGRSIHEAPYAMTPVQESFELDAGPVFSTHQRPINSKD